MKLKYIMFTKHLEGLDIPGVIKALQAVGVEGADLCVRPGYPVNPENVAKKLPEAAKQFANEGLSLPLVTTPGDFVDPKMADADPLYAACQAAGVEHIKLGYWHWSREEGYWQAVGKIRQLLEGFQELSQKYGVKTCIHNHSGTSMGLNSCAAMNLVKGFDPQYIGVFADPGHLSIVGEPIAMALNIVKDYLALLAFKDLMRAPGSGTKVVRMGQGFVDWETLLRTLAEMNFNGPVSFHSEYSGEPINTVIDLARIDVRFINGLIEKL
jgi:sugar phosphate isomerase/epimerase